MTDRRPTAAAAMAAAPRAEASDELQLIDCGLQTLRGLEREIAGPRLVRLNLHSNHLARVDIDLRPCTHLRQLNLSSNDLSSLAGLGLPQLQQLNVACNRLCRIDDLRLDALQSLRRLNLSYNQIKSLAPLWSAAGGHPLESLQLHGNLISRPDEAAHLRGFARLTEVTFSADGAGNPMCSQPGYLGALAGALPPSVAVVDGLPMAKVRAAADSSASPPPPPPPPAAAVAEEPSLSDQSHIDAALQAYRHRRSASPTGTPDRQPRPRSVGKQNGSAEMVASKRIVHALNQELRLEKLENTFARIIPLLHDRDPSAAARRAQDVSSRDARRREYHPRYEVDTTKPGLGRVDRYPNFKRKHPTRVHGSGHTQETANVHDDESGGWNIGRDESESDSHDSSIDSDSDDDSASADESAGAPQPRDPAPVVNPWGSKRVGAVASSCSSDGTLTAECDEIYEDDAASDTNDGKEVRGTSLAPHPRANRLPGGRDTQVKKVVPRGRARPQAAGAAVHSVHSESSGFTARGVPDRQARSHGQGGPGTAVGLGGAKGSKAEAASIGGSKEAWPKSLRDGRQERGADDTLWARGVSEWKKRYEGEKKQVEQLLKRVQGLEEGVRAHEQDHVDALKMMEENLANERAEGAKKEKLCDDLQLELAAAASKHESSAAGLRATLFADLAETAQNTAQLEDQVRSLAQEASAAIVASKSLEKQLAELRQTGQTAAQAASSAEHEATSLRAGMQNLREEAEMFGERFRIVEAEKESIQAACEASTLQLQQELQRVRQDCDKSHAEGWELRARVQAAETGSEAIKTEAAHLSESHRAAACRFEADVEAYRRSEEILKQRIEQLEKAMSDEQKRAVVETQDQHSMHLMQMKTILEEATLKKVAESEDAAKSTKLQRQLATLEESSLERQTNALKKQQEFELALIQASNKVEELKELLRVSIRKEARSTASATELSQAIRDGRRKLNGLASELERSEDLRTQLQSELADAREALVKQQTEWTAEQRQLQMRCGELERDVLQRECSVESLREEIESQQSSLTVWAEKEREQALSSMQEDLSGLQNDLAASNAALKVAETVSKDQSTGLGDLKSENKTLKEENAAKTRALDDEQELTSDLRSQVVDKVSQCQDVDAEAEHLRRELDRNAEESDNYLAALKSKEAALKFVEGEVEELKSMFDSKEERLKNELQQQHAIADELRLELASIVSQVGEFERFKKNQAGAHTMPPATSLACCWCGISAYLQRSHLTVLGGAQGNWRMQTRV